MHNANGLRQIVGIDIFQQEAARTRRKRIVDVFIDIERRKNKHRNIGRIGVARKLSAGFDAVFARHANIHEQHVGAHATRQCDGIGAIDRLAHHFNAGKRRKNEPEALANQVLVIGNGDPNGCAAARLIDVRHRVPPPRVRRRESCIRGQARFLW